MVHEKTLSKTTPRTPHQNPYSAEGSGQPQPQEITSRFQARRFLLCPEGMIQPVQLPEDLRQATPAAVFPEGLTLKEQEKRVLREALERHG